MQLRCRYMFPSADLVTEIPTVDRSLDRLAQAIMRRRHVWPGGERRVVVLGFPRSANTLLTYTLRDVAKDDVVVLDGRLTHSALDLHRLAGEGVVVVVPVRRPEDAVASWMVRRGRPAEIAAARRKLRAYGAWHRVAAKAIGRQHLLVIPFETAITRPQVLAEAPVLRELLADTGRRSTEEIMASMEGELAGESGQGVGVDDVPSEWMISLPRPERSAALARAHEIVRDSSLAPELARAESAYARVLDRARRARVLVGGVSVGGSNTAGASMPDLPA